ncbi:TetR/AcrR family transcriptional regulator [Nonomuraea sp. NPDC050540]|uniref:TetR/AcrR family transcriptional regulator n=1 Tax=Nonomuraea sp. NPDC050540 TaxID=3364367 RepID=UPI0037BCD320
MTRRNEASRQAILTAAFDLVGEIGYSKLSVEGIASRAGVGKQTIYRWWPSKGAVLLDALLMTMGGPVRELKRRRLRAAQEAGQLDLDLDAAVDLLWGPLLSRWLQRTGPLDHGFAARTITMALPGMSRKM